MSKADYGFLIKRYEQFKITNFEEDRVPMRKTAQKSYGPKMRLSFAES